MSEGLDQVVFIERSGPDAEQALRAAASELRGAGAEAELLRSADRSDLWLLVVRGRGADLRTLPSAGARVWRFTRTAGTT